MSDSAGAVLAALRERMIEKGDSALLTLPAAKTTQFRPNAFRQRPLRSSNECDGLITASTETDVDRLGPKPPGDRPEPAPPVR